MITKATRDSDGYIWYYDCDNTPQRLTIAIFHDTKHRHELDGADYARVLFHGVPQSDECLVAMCEWCMKYYGEYHCSYTPGHFWFDDPEDAVMFKLRWG